MLRARGGSQRGAPHTPPSPTLGRALLEHEQELNSTIAEASEAYIAGSKLPEYIRMVNTGERGLRAAEAAAASRKVLIAQRDAIVEQLNYLVMVQTSGAADTEAAIARTARETVESKLEKDSALQQSSIANAIRALKDGVATPSDDIIAPLYTSAVSQARADFAARTSEKPLSSQHQIDLFKKRFGYTDTAVTASALERASKDPVSLAVLKGKVGGKEPSVGLPFTLKAPILYAKK